MRKPTPVGESFEKLVELMERLRGPQGCPWDRAQTRESLKPMLIEEAHEVLEALDSPHPAQLCDELGDLLFQIIFHAQMAAERGEFDITQVVTGIVEKMTRRHPHVFGDMKLDTADDVLRNWEDLKTSERHQRGISQPAKDSLLDGVPASLPALYECFQISSKAARVGFDWPDLESLLLKLREEGDELRAAIASEDAEPVRDEVGDLLFAAVNVARLAGVDPETALRRSNRKFRKRFQRMEQRLAAEGRDFASSNIETLEEYWQATKTAD